MDNTITKSDVAQTLSFMLDFSNSDITSFGNRYWIDTEFIDVESIPITLVSIGIVSEDGRELYLINNEFPIVDNSWLRSNVYNKLEWDKPELWRSLDTIAINISSFVKRIDNIEPKVWGYYADYDWVMLSRIFGSMLRIPEWIPQYCRDIKQLVDAFEGLIDREKFPDINGHNALTDAKQTKALWEYYRTRAIEINPEYYIFFDK